MAGGDKQIKFTFAIDEGSFTSLRSKIRELTTDVKGLVEQMGRAGQGMGGGMGGGLFGGMSGKAGGINTSQESIKMPGVGGGPANALTQMVLANKSLLKDAADGSRGAFKAMTDGLRQAVTDQTSQIDKLQAKLSGLNQTYNQIRENNRDAMKPGGSEADRAFTRRQMDEHREQLFETHKALKESEGNLEALQEMEGPNPYSGILGRGKKARGRYNAATADSIGYEDEGDFTGAAAPQGLLSKLGGMAGKLGYTGTGMGGGLKGLARAAGPGLAIAGAYEALNATQLSRDATVADYTLWQGTDRQNRAAQTNQAIGGMGMRMKNDASYATAASRMTPTDIAGVIGREAMSSRLTQAYQQAGGGGSLSSTGEDIKDWAARVMDASEENLSAKDQSLRSMAMDKATAGLDVQGKQALVEQVGRKHEAMNLQEKEDINYYAGAASSRLGAQRAYGSGKKRFIDNEGNEYKHPGKRWADSTGEYMSTPQGLVQGTFMSAAMTAGDGTRYSSAEIGGQMAGLRGSIGGRFAGEGLAAQVIGLNEGGLGNAAQLYGNAAGYGNAQGFMGAITGASRMGGAAGYVDVPAASQVAGAYQGQMMSSDMFTSGVSGMQGMMATVGSMGGDLRAARAAQGGMGILGNMMGGTTDNLQRGINVLSSVESGAKGVVTQEALMNMSEAQRMDLMRQMSEGVTGKGGKKRAFTEADLPEELRMQGVTTENLKKYGQSQDKFMFARSLQGQGLSSDVEDQIKSFQEKGFESLHGLKGPALEKAFKRLGMGLKTGGHKGTLDENIAAMKQRAASEDPELVKALKGGGIGVSVSDDELQQKVEDDREKRRREVDHGAQNAALAATAPGARNAAQAAIAEGANLNGSIKSVTGILSNLATAVKTAATALDKVQVEDKGRTSTGAPGKK